MFLVYCSCRNLEKHNYRFETHLYTDSVKYLLFKDMLLIDSAKYVAKYEIINGYTPYQVLNIDIFEQGWSCMSFDTISNYNKIYLQGRFNYENKFLNRIIDEENLKARDSIKILDYWQILNSNNLKLSNEPDWHEIIDLFYDKFVFNADELFQSKFKLDQCEIQMYNKILNELKYTKTGIYYATTWAPEFLEEESLRKFKFDNKRLEIISDNGMLKVVVSGGNYLEFR